MIENSLVRHYDPPEVDQSPLCLHCGQFKPDEHGVCDYCREDIGAIYYKCTRCQQRCELEDHPLNPGMWMRAACCRAPYYRCDADANELAQMARKAADEGEERTAATLQHLADAERRAA